MTGQHGPEPVASKPDAGVVFRIEMWITNVVLGYWPHVLVIVAVGLVGVLVYGKYASWDQAQQRRASNEISSIEAKLYRELVANLDPEQRAQVAQVTDELPGLLMVAPPGPEDHPLLLSTADELAVVAGEGGGTARVEAWLKAAELYRIGGDDTKRREALEQASDKARGALRYAAEGGLADLELEAGQGDAAVARLRSLSEGLDGYLAEQTLLDLGAALESLDRKAEAEAVYSQLLEKYPGSPRAEQAEERRSRLATTAPVGAQ